MENLSNSVFLSPVSEAVLFPLVLNKKIVTDL